MENLNNKIMLVCDHETQNYGIALSCDWDEKIIYENINKINFQFIKYCGVKLFQNKNKEKKYYHFVAFNSVPYDMVETILSLIKRNLKKYEGSLYDFLNYIVSLFKKYVFPKNIENELRGDICEALFILKAKSELNLDLTKYYRSENELYDLYIKESNTSIDVKGSTKNSSKIKITLNQINSKQNDDRVFYVVEYQFIDNGKSIFDLYKKIGLENSSVIKNKYDKWLCHSSDDDSGKDLINKVFLVDEDNVNCFRFNNQLVPKINIDNNDSLIKADFYLSTKNANDGDITTLFEYIKNVN